MHYLTVVFEIEDNEAFSPLSQSLFDSMAGQRNLPGARVTGAAIGDLLTEQEEADPVHAECFDSCPPERSQWT